MWQPIATAPFDNDLALAVIDKDGVHALVFPCRRSTSGWVRAGSRERILIRPTHWQEWQTAPVPEPVVRATESGSD